MSNFTSQFHPKIAGLFVVLSISISFSPLFATEARAIPVEDFVTEFNTGVITSATGITAGNTTLQNSKDLGFDGVAWALANLVVERMAASTVNWINGGFKGSPAFVTDPDKYFKDLGDKVAGQAIFNNPKLNFLCGPIQAKVRLALTKSYIGDRQWQCTLTQVGQNFEDFMDDFGNGGWENFFELTQKTQNNPIGAYLQAENELYVQIANKQANLSDELNRGRGFLSYKSCKRWEPTPNFGELGPVDWSTGGVGGEYEQAPPGKVCTETETVTPGSVISDQLNNVLGIGNDKLAAADEINEIVSALLNQAVSRVVGGIGKGLRGLSSRDQANNTTSNSFADQLLQRKPGDEIRGYFCLDPDYNPNFPDQCQNWDTQDTSILDIQVQAPPEPVYPGDTEANFSTINPTGGGRTQ